ncbi:MAG: hypothetical protein HC894_31705, partial [Microcoleus sp. SM1_3_4]|nr:hypothetical protein [Microcoleus sp. SM1_3_4]
MPPIFYTVTRYDDVDDPTDGRTSIREAVALAAQHPGPDGIILNDQVRLTRPIEIRTNNSLRFDSGNLGRGSFSGQNITSLFLIERQNPGENVVFNGIDLVDGVARGGNGGGGGGLGAGGALYLAPGADVLVENVGFFRNQAIGGSAGNGGGGGRGGNDSSSGSRGFGSGFGGRPSFSALG